MNLKNQCNAAIKFLLIAAFFSLSIAILIILEYHMKGYNLSIYASIPVSGMIFLISPILIGIMVSLESYRKRNDFWKLGILLIVFSNFIFLILPFILGYAFSAGADNLTHIGFINDILRTSQIDSYLDLNVYPIVHLIIAEISLITKLPVNSIVFFIGPFYYVSFLFFTYIFVRKFTSRSKIFALLVSTILFCYYYKEIFPMGFAFLIFPLIFYVYYQHRRKMNMNYAIPLLILIFVLPFIHVIPAIILTVILLIFEIVNIFINKGFFKKRIDDLSANKYEISFTLVILSFMIIMLWMWQMSWLWKTSVFNVIDLINFNLPTVSLVNKAGQSFNMMGLDLTGILKLFIKVYGPIVLFSLLAGWSALGIIYRKNLSSTRNKFIFVLSVIIVFCMILWVTDIVHPLTTLTSGRLIWLIIPLFPIFVGISLFNFYQLNLIGNEIITLFVIFLIIGISSLGALFTIYPSPEIYEYNTAVSVPVINGADWLFSNGNNSLQILSPVPEPVYRYQDSLSGTLTRKHINFNNKFFADHFGYDNTDNLGANYHKDTYLFTLPNLLLSLYSGDGLYSKINRYNESDFDKLGNDPTTSNIYDNGNVETWFITGKK